MEYRPLIGKRNRIQPLLPRVKVPWLNFFLMMRCRQAGRHVTLTDVFVGSNPTTAATHIAANDLRNFPLCVPRRKRSSLGKNFRFSDSSRKRWIITNLRYRRVNYDKNPVQHIHHLANQSKALTESLLIRTSENCATSPINSVGRVRNF